MMCVCVSSVCTKATHPRQATRLPFPPEHEALHSPRLQDLIEPGQHRASPSTAQHPAPRARSIQHLAALSRQHSPNIGEELGATTAHTKSSGVSLGTDSRARSVPDLRLSIEQAQRMGVSDELIHASTLARRRPEPSSCAMPRRLPRTPAHPPRNTCCASKRQLDCHTWHHRRARCSSRRNCWHPWTRRLALMGGRRSHRSSRSPADEDR